MHERRPAIVEDALEVGLENLVGMVDTLEVVGVGDLLERAADQYRDKLAIVGPEANYTFAELRGIAAKVRTVLAGLGIKSGDRVALLGRNSGALLAAYWGIVTMGACAVPVNFRLEPLELERIFADCRAQAIFADGAQAKRLREEGLDTMFEFRCICLDELGPDSWSPWSTVVCDDVEPDKTIWEYSLDDACEILYTAGTTGHSKGAVRTFWNVAWYSAIRQPPPDSVSLLVPPMFHIAGLEGVVLATLVSGGTTILQPNFDLESWFEAVQTHRVTHAFIVPTMAVRISQSGLGSWDVTSLRRLSCGASATSMDVLMRLRELFPHASLPRVIGSTETGAWAGLTWGDGLNDDPSIDHASAIGPTEPLRQVRLVSPDGEVVESGTPGEAWVRSPATVARYWSIEAPMGDLEGVDWFRTGDLAQRDENGYMYIVGRLKDLIISGGENVYATEVEEVVGSVAGVREVAAVGVPDEVWGEVVGVALVIDESFDEASLHEICKTSLAVYKRPKVVTIVPSLPRNALGKVRKEEVRRMVSLGRKVRGGRSSGR